MFNRNLPWNQFGINVSSAKSVEEALNLAELNWTVDSKPIFDSNGKIIEGFSANTRSSDGEVLGIVGKRYQVVQNIEAFDFTNSLVDEGVTFDKAGVFHHGRAVWLLAKLPETAILGDKFDPYVVFINSHDGTGAIKVAMTPIRIACSNSLNVALRKASRSWSTRHMGNINQKLSEAKHTLGMANDYMSMLSEEADKLVNKTLTKNQFEEIFDSVFPIDQNNDSNRKVNNILDMKEGMFRALEADDLSNFRGTAWGALNAVTDYVDHASPARLTSSFEERRWEKIASGHATVDSFFEKISRI